MKLKESWKGKEYKVVMLLNLVGGVGYGLVLASQLVENGWELDSKSWVWLLLMVLFLSNAIVYGTMDKRNKNKMK